MVGLRNRSTWEPLLLKASCIKSCANGCSMGINAQLTYANSGVDSVEGVFVYPLGEKEVVVGFEAVIAGRLMGVQIQSRGNLKECCLDCCPGAGLEGLCENGHLILDEDLERTTFIVGTGIIGPRDIVSIIISTTLELPTIENGAIRIVYPTLLTPIAFGFTAFLYRATSCFGATSGKPDRTIDPGQRCAYAIFTNPASNLQPYELNFQLLVRGACLLAGLESPTHALRADADPSAQSASSTYITLAQEHPYDRHIEIILHLSEPHSPLVILERGRLSFYQYEQQICARRDFIRSTRKDSDPERKLEFVRRRHHKDILNSPVLMLNFCPDLLCEPVELHKATRELLFLIDRSGSMSGTNIHRVKSLPPGTMLNIVGFGTTIKPLFSSSKLCTDVSFTLADMRGTNLLGALSWLYQQPMQRSHPRQVFIVTDGTISNVAKVLELVRRNMCPLCRVMQPIFLLFLQLIKSLKKAFEPVLTDVRIDWYLPEHMEALLSPNDIAPLYPGDRLIGYCTLYDMTAFYQSRSDSSHRGKVFPKEHFQAESLTSKRFSTSGVKLDWSSDVRRRIQETSYIQEQYVLTRCSLSSEQSLQTRTHSHLQASNSHSAGGAFLPKQRSSAAVLDTGSLPQGLEKVVPPEQRSSLSHGLFPASPMDWDSFADTEYHFMAAPVEDPPPGQCRSMIHGLLSGRSMSWVAGVDLSQLWCEEEEEEVMEEGREEGRGEKPWEQIIHQLTARSVIRDFEKMAEKEGDTGHGEDSQTHLHIHTSFLLSEIYSDCVQIPLDRLKRASPYSLHRRSLSPAFRCTSPSAPSLSTTGRPLSATTSHHVTFSPSNQSHGQVDSGRGSETDVCEGFATDTTEVQGSNQLAQDDLEGSSWATAVALAWLEHRCAGYFMEWELVAAKADFWLRGQELPEGVDLSGLKGAARQLFLLLRHWDENIKLNMLCYNPNNM
uniref:von Willebrand factor A domain containing 5B2 n=1 Tax=Gouania willdenowi TaxID=441366 RepID=A0A8C5GIN3_GOUWI